jgi:hypothetical protein
VALGFLWEFVGHRGRGTVPHALLLLLLFQFGLLALGSGGQLADSFFEGLCQ